MKDSGDVGDGGGARYQGHDKSHNGGAGTPAVTAPIPREAPAAVPADAVSHQTRPYKLPDTHFDVKCATDRELRTYGLPPRPDERTHPKLAAKWARVAERRLTFIKPELQVMPSIKHRGVRDRVRDGTVSDAAMPRP